MHVTKHILLVDMSEKVYGFCGALHSENVRKDKTRN